ncbi:MAG: MerR family transcriptional regulator, partial [Bacillus sp. (in: firmicutes)]|nr:MerR family transcriptional regulator [Bacillus sp. (in: firmicutes)]
GNRKYSFDDVEKLIDIANKREEGIQTNEIRQEMIREMKKEENRKIRKQMIKGQINARFGIQKE